MAGSVYLSIKLFTCAQHVPGYLAGFAIIIYTISILKSAHCSDAHIVSTISLCSQSHIDTKNTPLKQYNQQKQIHEKEQ